MHGTMVYIIRANPQVEKQIVDCVNSWIVKLYDTLLLSFCKVFCIMGTLSLEVTSLKSPYIAARRKKTIRSKFDTTKHRI